MFVTHRLANANVRPQVVLLKSNTSPTSASAVKILQVATDIRFTALAVTIVYVLVTIQLAMITWHSRPGFLKIATANVMKVN